MPIPDEWQNQSSREDKHMKKVGMGVIVVLAIVGFGFDSAVHVQKRLSEYLLKNAPGGNVCACDNMYRMSTGK